VGDGVGQNVAQMVGFLLGLHCIDDSARTCIALIDFCANSR
jgi:hypothetical protein